MEILIGLLIYALVFGVLLLLVSKIVPGIEVESFGTALVAGLVMGVLNAIVRPILTLISLPLIFLTLGLFLLVLNALMLKIAAAIVPGFRVESFGAAFIGAILLAVFSLGMTMFG